ncbi:MAG: hypothetical protein IJZ84_02150 [Lachnospiraceae bacterium]|nr:hypothetical protein [Lachnospiraceae bacterium]
MTKDEYWNKFAKTGCIADYLAYTAVCRYGTEEVTNSREDFNNTYAGFNMCDRDDSQIRTNR